MSVVDVHLPQHLSALAHANEVRLKRAAFKREVAALSTADGLRKLAEAILHDDPRLSSARIGDVLMWLHRFGRTRMLRTLPLLRVSESKRLGTLTTRQRLEIHRALHAIAGGA